MRELGVLSNNEKWDAVVNCDKNYDGAFLYGVKTTGIFCRPSCRSKTPARENVTFFENSEKAVNMGFRPCKRCRPDKKIFDPDSELVIRAKDIFDAGCNNRIDLNDVAKQLGVSTNHLIKLFKQHWGVTAAQYIAGIRVDKAMKLLKQSDINILEIAYATGFKSVSNFYKTFREKTGYAPNGYRKSRGD